MVICSPETAELKTAAEQESDIMAVKGLNGYLEFYSVYYPKQTARLWTDKVLKQILKDQAGYPDDLFKLMALNAVLGSECGYSSMYGQYPRHLRKGWQKSFLDPLHQLSLAIYISSINIQLIPVKEKWFELIARDNPVVAQAVWGIPVDTLNGVPQVRGRSFDGIKGDVYGRYSTPQPICLPNKGLNEALAGIDFDGNTADIAHSIFAVDGLYTAVSDVLGKFLDPKDIFW